MAGSVLMPGGVVSMTAQAADRLLKAGSGDAALLYLHLLRRGGQFDPDVTRKVLGWTGDRLSTTYRALGDLGLVDQSAPVESPSAPPEPQGPPDYTAADIAREMEGATPFPHLVREMEKVLGKVLSTTDLKTLYTLFDYLALPAEVILLLSTWCAEETERKYGAGHKPRMSQIKKEAFVWKRLGVDTAEAADAHMRHLSALRGRERKLLPMLGIAGRAPVEGERKYIGAWVEMGFDDEAIHLAYEKTVLKKGALNWAYMNSILRSWHQKGLHTVEQVEAGDSAWRKSRAAAPGAAPRRDPDRVEDELDWMDRYLKETRKEGT